ncbi:MAG: hypothetical protein B7733_23025 [Myxococcales bacterium FL481]|nr:MAG: hypothetical protein B7733_23025 [Myxococcales bacterium FL481]
MDVAAGLEWRRVRAELGAWYATPRHAAAAFDPVFGGRYQAGAARGRGCGVTHARRLSVPWCVTVELGAVQGQGRQLDNAQTSRGTWLGVGPSTGLGFALGSRLRVRLDLTGLVSVLRPRFVTGQRSLMYATGQYGGRAVLALQWLRP